MSLLDRLRAAWAALVAPEPVPEVPEDPAALAAAIQELEGTLGFHTGENGRVSVLGLRGAPFHWPQLESAIGSRFPELSEFHQAALADYLASELAAYRRELKREVRRQRSDGTGFVTNFYKGHRSMADVTELAARRMGRD